MEAEPTKAEPKRKRRWFQFGMRTLFVVFTIASVQGATCFPPLKE